MKKRIFKFLVLALVFSGIKLKSIVAQQPLTVTSSSSLAPLDDINLDDLDEVDAADGSTGALTVAQSTSRPALTSSPQFAGPMVVQVVHSWQQVISDINKLVKALTNIADNNAALEKKRVEFMQELQALLSQKPKTLGPDNASSLVQLTAGPTSSVALLPPPA